ncbi:hypothetical protein Zmor_003813 [Zophobas morio]|uniref:Uncharacterized protein n=1 Tax=Zophobas morio TaxID=2755281 RepID=A0AA38M1Q1_9CUCU|nr:hypothetical protein Zmor_003813 [Zophobas morio]
MNEVPQFFAIMGFAPIYTNDAFAPNGYCVLPNHVDNSLDTDYGYQIVHSAVGTLKSVSRDFKRYSRYYARSTKIGSQALNLKARRSEKNYSDDARNEVLSEEKTNKILICLTQNDL